MNTFTKVTLIGLFGSVGVFFLLALVAHISTYYNSEEGYMTLTHTSEYNGIYNPVGMCTTEGEPACVKADIQPSDWVRHLLADRAPLERNPERWILRPASEDLQRRLGRSNSFEVRSVHLVEYHPIRWLRWMGPRVEMEVEIVSSDGWFYTTDLFPWDLIVEEVESTQVDKAELLRTALAVAFEEMGEAIAAEEPEPDSLRFYTMNDWFLGARIVVRSSKGRVEGRMPISDLSLVWWGTEELALPNPGDLSSGINGVCSNRHLWPEMYINGAEVEVLPVDRTPEPRAPNDWIGC